MDSLQKDAMLEDTFPEQLFSDLAKRHPRAVQLISNKKRAIGCLWSALSSVLPQAISQLSLEANFFDIGGDSNNTMLTISKLNEAGYSISVSDFINSETLLDIVKKMVRKTNKNTHDKKYSNKYKFDQISEKYKGDIYRIISDSYFNKSVLERNMEPHVEKHEYIQMLDALWPKYINNPLSYVIKNIDSDDVIGCALIMDIVNDVHVRLQSNYDYVIEFLEYLEKPIKEKHLPKGKIVYGDMLATDQKLSPQENVEVVLEMAMKLEDIARENGFIGIFTTNSSPLTKEVSQTVLNFNILKSYQINNFIASDGTRPFKNADDSVTVTTSFKDLY